ncbi:hypothetical protein [uncultured Chryseobacterium sp.]|uniref:hypothetical protein n=1 Tax=uncultured Chryseobacterium sp. TaxID=259322 RepID=UPI0025DBB1DE|nr:hypothetical protein [uncultured Chryseobacterium sp.]
MKTNDVDMIEFLLDQNEIFYDKGLIDLDEYDRNSFHLIERMEILLKNNEKEILKTLVLNEFTLPKFRLSIETIKAVTN